MFKYNASPLCERPVPQRGPRGAGGRRRVPDDGGAARAGVRGVPRRHNCPPRQHRALAVRVWRGLFFCGVPRVDVLCVHRDYSAFMD